MTMVAEPVAIAEVAPLAPKGTKYTDEKDPYTKAEFWVDTANHFWKNPDGTYKKSYSNPEHYESLVEQMRQELK